MVIWYCASQPLTCIFSIYLYVYGWNQPLSHVWKLFPGFLSPFKLYCFGFVREIKCSCGLVVIDECRCLGEANCLTEVSEIICLTASQEEVPAVTLGSRHWFSLEWPQLVLLPGSSCFVVAGFSLIIICLRYNHPFLSFFVSKLTSQKSCCVFLTNRVHHIWWHSPRLQQKKLTSWVLIFQGDLNFKGVAGFHNNKIIVLWSIWDTDLVFY